MDFYEEIEKAMKQLKEACAKNTDWSNCHGCPFEECCEAFWDAHLPTPDMWGEDE